VGLTIQQSFMQNCITLSDSSRVLSCRPYPASYCGESKRVSNKYHQANYTHPLQLRQSQAFRPLLVSTPLALNHAPS